MKTHSKTIEIVFWNHQIGEIEKNADDYSANPCRNLPKSVNNKRCLRFANHIHVTKTTSGKSQGYCGTNGFCLKDGRISVITSRQLQISKHHAGRSLIFGRAESVVASSTLGLTFWNISNSNQLPNPNQRSSINLHLVILGDSLQLRKPTIFQYDHSPSRNLRNSTCGRGRLTGPLLLLLLVTFKNLGFLNLHADFNI